MSLFDKFLRTISSMFPSGLTAKEAALLAQLDPRKIYVENVLFLLGVSHAKALSILETAVRQGVFEKRVEVLCPDGTVAASAESEDELPDTVHCWTQDDEHEEELLTKDLRKTVWYRLNEHSAHDSFQRTA